MPIFMDVHIVPGVKARSVAEAHQLDLAHQEEYGCKCMTYWIDEQRESIFCLIEATDKDMVQELHRNAHGLVPNKIIEVSSSVVESFLGRIYDPQDAEQSADGLKVFADPSFRVLLVTQTTDPLLLQHKLGKDKAAEIIRLHNTVVRANATKHEGKEVEHGGDGFILSFTAARSAVACALAIQNEFPEQFVKESNFRIGLNAGEPIEKSNDLFGDTIQLATWLCSIAPARQISLSSRVKELVAKDLESSNKYFQNLSISDEQTIRQLFNKLEGSWQDAEFDIPEYCQAMAMSKSQLYRKTINLTGLSPNILLKDYRLEKAKELMKKKPYSISQITFESGFTSPSYFTKCFKKKFGLLPMAYLELLH